MTKDPLTFDPEEPAPLQSSSLRSDPPTEDSSTFAPSLPTSPSSLTARTHPRPSISISPGSPRTPDPPGAPPPTQLEASIPNMAAIIAAVHSPRPSLPALDARPADVRTWFTAVLELKYDMDAADAMAAVAPWRLLGGAALREADRGVFVGVLGEEVGWALWREVRAGVGGRRREEPWVRPGVLIHGVGVVAVGLAWCALGNGERGREGRVGVGIAAGICAWLFGVLYLGYYYS